MHHSHGTHRVAAAFISVAALGVSVAACGDEASDEQNSSEASLPEATQAGASLPSTEPTGTQPTSEPDTAPTAPVPTAPAELSKTRIEYIDSLPGMNSISVYTAIDEGFYDEVGLELDVADAASGGASVPAVASGQIDATFSTLGSIAAAVSEGGQASVVLPVTIGLDYQLAVDAAFASEHGIQGLSISELEGLRGSGMTVGVTRPGGGFEIAVRATLEGVGLQEGEDFEFVNLQDANEILANFNGGQTDAMAGIPPLAYRAEDAVLVPIGALSPAFEGAATQVQSVSADLVNDHPDTVRAFVSATWRGFEFAADEANSDRVVEILVAHAGFSEEDARRALEAARPIIPTEPCITPDQFDKGMALANLGLEEPIVIAYEEIVNTEFCGAAQS